MEFLPPLHLSLLWTTRRDLLILLLIGDPAISKRLGQISRALWPSVRYDNAGYIRPPFCTETLDSSRFETQFLYRSQCIKRCILINVSEEVAFVTIICHNSIGEGNGEALQGVASWFLGI